MRVLLTVIAFALHAYVQKQFVMLAGDVLRIHAWLTGVRYATDLTTHVFALNVPAHPAVAFAVGMR